MKTKWSKGWRRQKGKRVWYLGGWHFRNINLKQARRGIGMRHTFHRPLWSAFHFYLYLPPRELPSPTSRDFIYTVVLRVNGAQGAETTGKAIEDGRGWVGKGWKNRCRNLSTRYFTTFCFQSEGRRCRGITRHRPYSTFMALNRDEVSTKLPSLPTFFLFSLPPSSPFLPSTLIRDSFSKRDGKWSLFDLSFRAGHSRIVARFSTIFQFEGRRIKFSEDRISVAERKNSKVIISTRFPKRDSRLSRFFRSMRENRVVRSSTIFMETDYILKGTVFEARLRRPVYHRVSSRNVAAFPTRHVPGETGKILAGDNISRMDLHDPGPDRIVAFPVDAHI